MNEYCIELDVNNICRVCIQNDVQLKAISQFDIIDGEILSFISIFETFFNLKIDKTDGLPQSICLECKKILIDAYILRKKCLKHDLLLRKIFNIPVNSEISVIEKNDTHENAITIDDLNKKQRLNSSHSNIKSDIVSDGLDLTNDAVTTADVISTNDPVAVTGDVGKLIDIPDNGSDKLSNDNQLLIANDELNDDEMLTNDNNKPLDVIDEDLGNLIEFSDNPPIIKLPANEVIAATTATETIVDINTKSNMFVIVTDEEAENFDYNCDDDNGNYSIEKHNHSIEIPDTNDDGNNNNNNLKKDDTIQNEQIYSVDYLDYDYIDRIDNSDDDDDDVDDDEDLYTILKITDDDNTNDYNDQDKEMDDGGNNKLQQESLLINHYDNVENDGIVNSNNKKQTKIVDNHLSEFTQCKLCKLQIKKNRYNIHKRMHDEILSNIFYNTQFYRCGLCHMLFIHANAFKEHIISSNNNSGTCIPLPMDHFNDRHSSDDNQSSSSSTSSTTIAKPSKSLNFKSFMNIKLYSITKFRISDDDGGANCDGDNDDDDDDHTEDNIIKCDYCSKVFIASTFLNLVNCIDALTLHYDKVHFQTTKLRDREDTYNNNNNMDIDIDNALADVNDNENDQILSIANEIDRNHLDTIPIEYKSTFKKKHICNICKETFNTLQLVIQHIYQHFDIYHCPLYTCGLCYDTFKKLSRHFEVQHSQFDRHACQYCKEEFDKYYKLKNHLRTECVKREIQCDFCSKTFFTKVTYRIHMQIHSNVKSYKCDVCCKAFTHRSDYETHYRTHTGEKPFKCAICEMGFRSNGNLTDHMSTHEIQKKFKCDECNKMFISSRTLRSHLNVHRGIHKYRCDVCDKGFLRRYHLTSHLRTHDKKAKSTKKSSKMKVANNQNEQ